MELLFPSNQTRLWLLVLPLELEQLEQRLLGLEWQWLLELGLERLLCLHFRHLML
jgi:hypothetical protein